MGKRYIKTDSIKDNGIPASKIDLPIYKGTGENSIVQNSLNNTAKGARSHAEGAYTTASGTSSHAEGTYTTASGDCSHAEGVYTKASSYNSHAEGGYTQAINEFEHAEGSFNLSIENKTIHTVGIGEYSTRKNAHEIHKDGKHYIFGIGGYDGTNSQTEGTKTVQEVITLLETRIAELENIISQIAIKEE